MFFQVLYLFSTAAAGFLMPDPNKVYSILIIRSHPVTKKSYFTKSINIYVAFFIRTKVELSESPNQSEEKSGPALIVLAKNILLFLKIS